MTQEREPVVTMQVRVERAPSPDRALADLTRDPAAWALGSALAGLGWLSATPSRRSTGLGRGLLTAGLVGIGAAAAAGIARRAHELAAGLEATRAELAHATSHDALTGLPNRRAFMAHFHLVFAAMNRYRRPLSVMMVDLDRFGEFNGAHGEAAGDAAVRAVADLLGASVRTADLVARLEGEAFGILLPETDQDGAMVLAERLRDGIEGLRIPGWPDAHLSASIGVVGCVPRAERNPVQVMNLVDKAVFKAKAGGRNRVEAVSTGIS